MLRNRNVNENCLTTSFPTEFVEDFIRVHQKLAPEEKLTRDKLISIFSASIVNLTDEQIYKYLKFLGFNKIVDNLDGGNKKVDNTNENTRVLQILVNNKIIESYELASDGKHYKKLRIKKTTTS